MSLRRTPLGRRARSAIGVVLLALVAAGVGAQENELVLPPRLEPGPGEARLEPPDPEKAPALEEIVVIGGSEWRLPDLGSSWRAEHEDEEDHGRIDVSFLPLYDPENADPNVDLFPRDREMRRVGFIEVFKIRFGGRSRTDSE